MNARGPAEGPARIRPELHSDAYSLWSETGIEHEVARVLDSADPLICLGGDHAITHPIMRAVRKRQPRLTILHIDAHADIVEYNPRCDLSNMTAGLAAKLLKEIAGVMIRTQGEAG